MKPSIEDKRDVKITVRFTEDEYEAVKRNAELANLRVAVYARHAILGRRLLISNPIVLDVRSIGPAISALGRVGNNINQVARWLNRHTSVDDGLRAEASAAFKEVVDCSHELTRLATEGVNAGVDAWRSLSTSR